MNPRGYHKGRTWSLHVNTIVSFCLFVVFHKKGGLRCLYSDWDQKYIFFLVRRTQHEKKYISVLMKFNRPSISIHYYICLFCLPDISRCNTRIIAHDFGYLRSLLKCRKDSTCTFQQHIVLKYCILRNVLLLELNNFVLCYFYKIIHLHPYKIITYPSLTPHVYCRFI